MTRYLTAIALLFTAIPAQAVLTVRIDGNGLSDFRVEDGSADDADGMLDGFITVDATGLTGWNAGGPGTFLITADSEQTHPSASLAGGQINVVADYDNTTGFAAVVTVAVADQFVVSGNPIESFSGFTEVVGDGLVTASNHYFHSDTPIVPADPFAFAGYGDDVDLVPGGGGPLDSTEGIRDFFLTPPVTLGIDLQVANQFTVFVDGGDVGSVASSTIVNPEPASMLLSGFGAVLFGFGYYRRRKSQPAEEA